MTEQTTKYPALSVLNNITPKLINLLTPENLQQFKELMKTLKLIVKTGIEKDIDIADITCQNYEEYIALQQFREKFAVLKRRASEQSMKKLFR